MKSSVSVFRHLLRASSRSYRRGLKTVVVTGLVEGDVNDHGPRGLETVRTGRGEA
jgi:hypothetical protein